MQFNAQKNLYKINIGINKFRKYDIILLLYVFTFVLISPFISITILFAIIFIFLFIFYVLFSLWILPLCISIYLQPFLNSFLLHS